MLNKLTKLIREQEMVQPGDTVVCAVSGGPDSIAMTFAFYLLKEKLEINLEAAHFNHMYRGEEGYRDENFVRDFCDRYDIPLHVGRGEVKAGKKGLEAAARDARYAYLRSLPGKIATAHTADDNAETVLMHMIRGTGLKGLGGITPVYGNVIRPLLSCTRQNVLDFLNEWCLSYITDSSNKEDFYLRNRIRHHVMPFLREENPKIGENLSRMALRLREDEAFLAEQADFAELPDVETLKKMHPAVRSRCLERFLKENGVREPEDAHIAQAEALVFSDKPSAWAEFPGGVRIGRNYKVLAVLTKDEGFPQTVLPCPGEVELPGLRVICQKAEENVNTSDAFTVVPEGQLILRSRKSGDSIRLPGGTKSLKKLFIDRKIPASDRNRVPVLCDDSGILGVYSIGVNLDRTGEKGEAVTVRFEKRQRKGE